MVERVALGDVAPRPPHDGRELQLVVHLVAVRRPGDLVLRPDHRVGERLVVGRHGVPLVRDSLPEACESVPEVTLEGQEVAHRARQQRGHESRPTDGTGGAHLRSSLDERDHVTIETGVDDLFPVEITDPAVSLGALVGHVPHRAASSMASTILR